MDTTTLPTNRPSKVYVQLPAPMQQVQDCINYLHQQGWKPKKFNFYNRLLRRYASVQELYPLFRNNNQ